MIQTTRFIRKPFEVQAVMVTAENMPDVAEWCQGEMIEEAIGRWYIKVDVQRVLHDRQKKAYIGDWVLKGDGGFKVFTEKAFKKSFQLPTNVPEKGPRTAADDGVTPLKS